MSASNFARDLQDMGECHKPAPSWRTTSPAAAGPLARTTRHAPLSQPSRRTLHGLGDYPRAQALQDDTLIRSRRAPGEDAPEMLRSAGDLAVTLQALGDRRALAPSSRTSLPPPPRPRRRPPNALPLSSPRLIR